jgi:hypothetical protein
LDVAGNKTEGKHACVIVEAAFSTIVRDAALCDAEMRSFQELVLEDREFWDGN